MFKKLITWSHSEFSYLPWRKNRTLYTTLVSEIMLQQTTVGTVLNHFERFLKEYPSVKALAVASEEELLISWKGLGYYRRARNLKKACETICNEHGGEIPLHFERLIKIPGIGEYTAKALISIGANKKALALDANLERVISRLYGFEEEKGPRLLKQINTSNVLELEIKEFGGRDVNEALMDLGRNFCQARKTSCDLCPLRGRCFSFQNNKIHEYPKQKIVTKEKHTLTLLRILLKKDDNFLIYKKSKQQWLSGQYEVPTFILESTDPTIKQYPKIAGDFSMLPEFKTAITKYIIKNKVLWINENELNKLNIKRSDYIWGSTNLSTATMKAIKL